MLEVQFRQALVLFVEALFPGDKFSRWRNLLANRPLEQAVYAILDLLPTTPRRQVIRFYGLDHLDPDKGIVSESKVKRILQGLRTHLIAQDEEVLWQFVAALKPKEESLPLQRKRSSKPIGETIQPSLIEPLRDEDLEDDGLRKALGEKVPTWLNRERQVAEVTAIEKALMRVGIRSLEELRQFARLHRKNFRSISGIGESRQVILERVVS